MNGATNQTVHIADQPVRTVLPIDAERCVFCMRIDFANETTNPHPGPYSATKSEDEHLYVSKISSLRRMTKLE